ncbi:hypothetical protein EVAR_55263_1 [Eumeta japonica]|uniref:Uncharacterized protein n=1 Tax=Eumeta variegata TaxID=151549 RepID=A0A4C1Z438_EUMVA|nr:hypothetical protein EVAR_55263_1 [Eumeta japonica]
MNFEVEGPRCFLEWKQARSPNCAPPPPAKHCLFWYTADQRAPGCLQVANFHKVVSAAADARARFCGSTFKRPGIESRALDFNLLVFLE